MFFKSDKMRKILFLKHCVESRQLAENKKNARKEF